MSRKKQVDISASSLSNLEGMLNANIENFGKAFNEKLESMQTDTKKVNQNITLTWSRAVDQTKSSMAGLLDTVSSGLQSSSDAGSNMIGVLEGVNNAITLIGDVGGIAAAFASGDVISGVASSISLVIDGLNILTQAMGNQQEPWEIMQETIETQKSKWDELVESQRLVAEGDLAQIEHTQSLWQELQTLVDENGNVKESDEERAKFITEELNKVMPDAIKWNEDNTVSINGSAEAIDRLIEKKKAQILLDAEEPVYREAIIESRKVEQQQMQLSDEILTESMALEDLYTQQKKAELDHDAENYQYFQTLINSKVSDLEKLKGTYNGNEATLSEYYKNIDDYESMSAAIHSDNYEKINEINQGYGSSFKTATNSTEEELKQQYINAELHSRDMQKKYAEGAEGVTEEMKRQAIEAAYQAHQEYKKVGRDSIDGIKAGLDAHSGSLYDSMETIISNLQKSAERKARINSPSKLFAQKIGGPIMEGIGVGFTNAAPHVFAKMMDAVASETGQFSNAVSRRSNYSLFGLKGAGSMGDQGGLIPASGKIKTVLNIDGREFAVATANYMSEELAWRNL